MTTHPPPTIMIVDDTPDNLHLLIRLLRDKGFSIMAFPDGESALQAAAVSPPDLVLLDIRMPGMDGFEVCQKLKADPELGHIPVLFISVMNASDQILQAFAAGGADYVCKPIRPPEVLARVETHLRLAALHRELQQKNMQISELAQQRTTELAEKNALLAERENRIKLSETSIMSLIGRLGEHRRGAPCGDCCRTWRHLLPQLAQLNDQVSAEVRTQLVNRALAAAVPSWNHAECNLFQAARLSARERETAALLSAGLSDREISASLGMSLRRVHDCKSSIRRKLGVPKGVSLQGLLAGDGRFGPHEHPAGQCVTAAPCSRNSPGSHRDAGP